MEGHNQTIDDVWYISRAVNIGDTRIAVGAKDLAGRDAAASAAVATHSTGIFIGDTGIAGKIHEGDYIEITDAKMAEIDKSFTEMAEDLDVQNIDKTLKVKNVWGAMATLSWNVTDCTMFTLGAGIGVPTVSKIDNLKRKIGFAGMFEIATKVAESLSIGLKYQFNRIRVKDANSATHHLSKVNGNLHIFSANLTYSF